MCIVVGIICAVVCGIIANQKGRNVAGWVALGFFFGIIPLIIVACLPNVNEQIARDAYIADENRRLREQIRQERIKNESFRQHATSRLDAHDDKLGMDTRQNAPSLIAGGIPLAGELGTGAPANDDTPRWFYGRNGQTIGPVKASEIAELIRIEIIKRETLLWSEELADWQPAGAVAMFAMNFS